MNARDRGPARILATPGSGAFDDVRALVTATRRMLDDAQPLCQEELRHLYVLATMAEAAWQQLDDAMAGPAR